MLKYMLDTNIVIYVIKRRPPALRLVFNQHAGLEVLPYGTNAAVHYGEIRSDLERKGMTIGINDLQIAGHARSNGLVLVTNDTREFERVDGLRMIDWTEKETESLT